jgi:VanZ family protein
VEDVAATRRAPAGLAWTWLPVLAYAAVIFYFSSRTGAQLPRYWFMQHDKVLHSIEYTGLGLLVCRGLRRSRVRPLPSLLAAAALALAFGASDEFHQSFVPGRQGNDLGDLLADAVGGTLGGTIATAIYDRLGPPGAGDLRREASS